MNTLNPQVSLGGALRLAAALLLLPVTALAQKFGSYDLVVPNSSTSVVTTIDGAGRLLPTDRSFVIGIESGTHGPIVFSNWTGTENFPVIIVNKGGKAVISDDGVNYKDGIQLSSCVWVQLRGDNFSSIRYGIEVAQAGSQAGKSRVGINILGASGHVEVMNCEVHHIGFAGIMAKNDPSASKPQYWAANYTMEDIRIHDNYVYDTGGEGMYIGYTSWFTTYTTSTGTPYQGHEIHGLRIYSNLIEQTGWEGAQVASNPVDTKVYNNVIFDAGWDASSGQGNGFQIGGGASGEYFNNLIVNSAINSLVIIGQSSKVSVYNNLLLNSGDYGIFAKNLPEPPPTDPNLRQTQPGSFVNILNNTIVNPLHGAYLTVDEISVNNFKNNLSIVPDVAYSDVNTSGGATVNTGGNLLQRDATGLNFANTAQNDYRIKLPSNAANVGVSLAALASPQVSITTDFQGLSRPQGTAYDAGFNEAGSLSVFLIANPPTTSGGNGTINASVIGGTTPYTYLWSTGATTSSITVPEGKYSVVVTDATGAKFKSAVFIRDFAQMGAPVSDEPALNQALAPSFSPASGTYTTPQTVTLSSATSGATIRYTLDGSAPSATNGIVYSGPFPVGASATVKAVAYKTGLIDSFASLASYWINNGPANAKFTVADANITESSHLSTKVKGLTVDGDLATYWQASGDGQWITFDLQANQRVGIVKLGFASGTARNYFFDLQVSTDGTTWTNVLTNNSSYRSNELQEYDIPDVDPVRYVRIVGHGNNDGNVNLQPLISLTEVEIWGGNTGSAAPRAIYQAEDASLSGALARTNQSGYTGTGFVDYINASGDYIEWTVSNPGSSMQVALAFRWASTSARTLAVIVNGNVVNSGLTFPTTGGANIWVDRAMQIVTLPSGTSTIRLQATGTSGPNLDYLKIQ